MNAQTEYFSTVVTDTIRVNFENKYTLSNISIIPFSESIILRDTVLNRKDYNFSYSTASFSLSNSLPYSIFDTLIVRYKTVKLSLQKEYKRRTLEIKFDEKFGDTVRVARSGSSITPESIFGSEIEKSGTLVRGFTVGTTKDFSLNSGLRLQLSGKLSKDIEVVAALTDENTPIQPEGNTERLEELDKVFIQIKHPFASGTFGDYQLQKRYGEFGIIDRKLQGLLGEYNYKGYSGYVSLAGAKGKFTTNNFNGIDGVQGPYRLSGADNERDIIIIAGSERVYIDGIEMKRGENNDYTIEYSNAQITFTPKRLITSASRISVDFEYTTRRYSRNFFGTAVASSFFDDKLGVKFQYIREGDDPDAPIDISLSDSDKTVLYNAGDERTKAVKSGISLAKPDSLGQIKGIYEKIDTLINDKNYSYYFYNPGSSKSIYNISFSYVGEQKGDYVRESLGNYRFVGVKQGSYLPVIFLPLPELKQIGNFVLNYEPFKDVTVSLEYAGSLWDKNRLSSLDEGDNFGYARNIFLQVKPQKIIVGKINLGKMGLSYKDRFIQDKFTSLDRFNEVEFNRDYNISQSEKPQNEQLREMNLNLIPIEELNIVSSLGLLNKGDDFKSTRYNNTLKFTNAKKLIVDYNLDYVDSKNLNLKSKWFRQKGDASYLLWKFKPGVEFLAEDKRDKQIEKDSLMDGSLKYYEVNPYLEFTDFHGLNLSVKYSTRQDFLPINGELFRESKSNTQYYELNYNGTKEVNSTVSLTVRDKKYSEIFKKKGQLDNQTILIRSQNRFNFWQPLRGDFFYEVSTQRSAKLQKVFVRVEKGTGNFKFLGDLNNNGVADENEFEPTVYEGDYIQVTVPTDQLYPVIDLKTSTKWKVNFGDIFDPASGIAQILKPVSTETYWRIEENSREEDYKKIYLLNFSAFQNEENTIQGSNYIQQDIFLFENDQSLNFRFRYAQRKSLNQYSGGVEKAYNRERSLRIRFKMIEEVNNQTELKNENDNVNAPSSFKQS